MQLLFLVVLAVAFAVTVSTAVAALEPPTTDLLASKDYCRTVYEQFYSTVAATEFSAHLQTGRTTLCPAINLDCCKAFIVKDKLASLLQVCGDLLKPEVKFYMMNYILNKDYLAGQRIKLFPNMASIDAMIPFLEAAVRDNAIKLKALHEKLPREYGKPLSIDQLDLDNYNVLLTSFPINMTLTTEKDPTTHKEFQSFISEDFARAMIKSNIGSRISKLDGLLPEVSRIFIENNMLMEDVFTASSTYDRTKIGHWCLYFRKNLTRSVHPFIFAIKKKCKLDFIDNPLSWARTSQCTKPAIGFSNVLYDDHGNVKKIADSSKMTPACLVGFILDAKPLSIEALKSLFTDSVSLDSLSPACKQIALENFEFNAITSLLGTHFGFCSDPIFNPAEITKENIIALPENCKKQFTIDHVTSFIDSPHFELHPNLDGFNADHVKAALSKITKSQVENSDKVKAQAGWCALFYKEEASLTLSDDLKDAIRNVCDGEKKTIFNRTAADGDPGKLSNGDPGNSSNGDDGTVTVPISPISPSSVPLNDQTTESLGDGFVGLNSAPEGEIKNEDKRKDEKSEEDEPQTQVPSKTSSAEITLPSCFVVFSIFFLLEM